MQGSEKLMAVPPIRVLIVEDEEMVRHGLQVLFEVLEDLELVGAAANRHDAIRLASELHPDVVLMDVMLSGLPQGIAAANTIHQSVPHVQIVALSAFFSPELTQLAKQAGIISFLSKTATAEEVAAAIRLAYAGRSTDL